MSSRATWPTASAPTAPSATAPAGSGAISLLANPYTLPRAIALYLGDVIREWWQAAGQAGRNVRPRIHRGFRYAFIRAATTTLMQEAALFMLLSDVYRGVPAVYVTLFAYDEVAHHSGIDRPDAFKVLATLDRIFAILERAVASAPRRYHLVILSDHGQSMGPTFRQQYGQTLGELVTGLRSSRAPKSRSTTARPRTGAISTSRSAKPSASAPTGERPGSSAARSIGTSRTTKPRSDRTARHGRSISPARPKPAMWSCSPPATWA